VVGEDVNLFNLLPVGILDGGRIWRSVVSSINLRIGKAMFLLSMALSAVLVQPLGSLTLGVILFSKPSSSSASSGGRPSAGPAICR
jgi:Zn-dependent protease